MLVNLGANSRIAFWLAMILFPPLGLVLLWRRPGLRLRARLAGTVLVLLISVGHLVFVWGLRMEVDGSTMRPFFYFGDAESHYAEHEHERAEQRASEPSAPVPAPTADVAAETESAVESNVPDSAPEPVEARPEPMPALPPVYWTDYRGPRRDGHYDETAILTVWPEKGLEEIWRHPIGGGYASFVVAGDTAFTIEQRRNQEVVAAYAMETGRELWTNSWDARFEEAMGGVGPRATPTWHEGTLYALGAAGELRAIDAATGQTLWRKNILSENAAQNLEWAMAASPLVVGEMLIVQPGGPGASVVAYDKDTGASIWKSLDDKQAYTSPALVTLAGQRQLIVVSALRVAGLKVEDGSLLWSYPWVTSYDVNAAQPVITGEDTFFISSGYGHGGALVRVSPDGDGWKATEVWSTNRMKNKFSSAVLYDGYIYGLDEAILACISAATGKLAWKGGRYGYGQVLLASGHLVITSERGEVVLVKATPESHQEIAKFPAVSGKTWNTPAIDGGRLLVRNAREMACYRISP